MVLTMTSHDQPSNNNLFVWRNCTIIGRTAFELLATTSRLPTEGAGVVRQSKDKQK